MKDKEKSVTERFLVVPYTEVDGVRNYTDSFIKGLFRRMRLDRMGPRITKYSGIQSETEWLAYVKRPTAYFFILYVEGQVGGLFWLDTFENRFARMHFWLFSNTWGRCSHELINYTLDLLIHIKGNDGEYLYDAFMGITPMSNRLTVRWLKNVDVVIQGTIPNAAFDYVKNRSEVGLITYYTRECLHEDLQRSTH